MQETKVYPVYYYSKSDHKAICLKNEYTFVSFQCKRYATGEERVSFFKSVMPPKDQLEKDLEHCILCKKEVYETVMKDYFAKAKEYRDIFYTVNNK